MTIERTHYIFGVIPVWKDRPEIGQPHFLKHLHRDPVDDAGFSFGGESQSMSAVVRSADILDLYSYNPNHGPMTAIWMGGYEENQIKDAHIEGDMGCCLGVLVGYRQRYSWKKDR